MRAPIIFLALLSASCAGTRAEYHGRVNNPVQPFNKGRTVQQADTEYHAATVVLKAEPESKSGLEITGTHWRGRPGYYASGVRVGLRQEVIRKGPLSAYVAVGAGALLFKTKTEPEFYTAVGGELTLSHGWYLTGRVSSERTVADAKNPSAWAGIGYSF